MANERYPRDHIPFSRAVKRPPTGAGVSWGEHDSRLHCGSAAFYRNGYRGHLVSEWLPPIDGVVERLEAGTRVADVGCGHGHSTILMAQAFPNSHFYGFDAHPASIDAARRLAAEAGLGDRVRFEVAQATEYPGAFTHFRRAAATPSTSFSKHGARHGW